MSEQDPPRMLEDASIDEPTRAALRSLAAPIAPYDPATASRVGALIAARTATPWLKLTLLGALVIGATTAPLAARWARSRPSPAPVTAPVIERRAAPPIAPAPEPAAPIVLRAPAPPSPSARPLVPHSAQTTAARPSHERVERDLLADAQRSLERDGDPRRALSLLAEHRRRFERSPLDEERSYLALRAHARLGDRAALERSGAVFLRRFATSIYAPAARRLLESAP